MGDLKIIIGSVTPSKEPYKKYISKLHKSVLDKIPKPKKKNTIIVNNRNKTRWKSYIIPIMIIILILIVFMYA